MPVRPGGLALALVPAPASAFLAPTRAAETRHRPGDATARAERHHPGLRDHALYLVRTQPA